MPAHRPASTRTLATLSRLAVRVYGDGALTRSDLIDMMRDTRTVIDGIRHDRVLDARFRDALGLIRSAHAHAENRLDAAESSQQTIRRLARELIDATDEISRLRLDSAAAQAEVEAQVAALTAERDAARTAVLALDARVAGMLAATISGWTTP